MEKHTAMKGMFDKARALAYRGEEDGGSEIVQVVIVLGFAVGLGAALMTLQNQINTSIVFRRNIHQQHVQKRDRWRCGEIAPCNGVR